MGLPGLVPPLMLFQAAHDPLPDQHARRRVQVGRGPVLGVQQGSRRAAMIEVKAKTATLADLRHKLPGASSI
jgi:hypothetical protein